MRAARSLKLAIILVISFLNPISSEAYEMLGMISYNLAQVTPKPLAYTSSSNGVGYTFLGRMDLGPGLLESGFQFILTSIRTQQTFGELKATGSYWILPLMYRYLFFPPF